MARAVGTAPAVLRRAAVGVLIVVLVEVGLSGRIDNPLLVVYAVLFSLTGTMAIGPKPREIGKWWGTIDQQIALEAQVGMVLAALLTVSFLVHIFSPAGQIPRLVASAIAVPLLVFYDRKAFRLSTERVAALNAILRRDSSTSRGMP